MSAPVIKCWCCGVVHLRRSVWTPADDPWEGRLDGYCDGCASARCDAYPGECHSWAAPGRAEGETT